jgi:hypothetical protein
MPGSADIAVRDRDRGDDEFADDEGDDGLPDGDSSSYEGAAELPVRECDLVYGPEGDEAVLSGQSVGLIDGLYWCGLRPSSPGSPMRRERPDVVVDPYVGDVVFGCGDLEALG